MTCWMSTASSPVCVECAAVDGAEDGGADFAAALDLAGSVLIPFTVG